MAKTAPPCPEDLRCEYLVDPVGIDVEKPRFFWSLRHLRRNQEQAAYRLVVAENSEDAEQGIGRIWDSGVVNSDLTMHVEYDGKPLKSSFRYFWSVSWQDRKGLWSPFAAPHFFETGLLDPSERSGRWISKSRCEMFQTRGSVLSGVDRGPWVHCRPMYFRKTFDIRSSGIRSARAYVSGIGLYELRINGQKVGDRVLDPAQTDYRFLALYSAYDIGPFLGESNVVAVILGNGRHIKNYGYGKPRLWLKIRLVGDDGEAVFIESDRSWKVSYGPLIRDGLYSGEFYDARLEMDGWDGIAFDDSEWEKAAEVDGPSLEAQTMPPIRKTEVLKTKSVSRPASGVFVFDFGANISGWASLRAQGPAGTEIRMRHAELVHEDGTLNPETCQNAEATDVFVLRGRGIEQYEPRFTVHGFRYMEVTGYPGVPLPDDAEACFVHTDVETAGHFFCSNERINRIHEAVLRGQKSNLMGVPTDCPQRDERYGWMADAHLVAEESAYNFGMASFNTKFLNDIRLSQQDDGSLPDFVPPYFLFAPADPAWGSAYAVFLDVMNRFYGDVRILKEHYDSLKKYVDFLQGMGEDHIQKKLGKYGDWCPPGSVVPKKTPVEFTSTWFYLHDVLFLARAAGILGYEEDQKKYSDLGRAVRTAFHEAFWEGDQYRARRISPVDKSSDQTSHTLALALDLAPAGKRADVLARLVHNVVNEQDSHLDTGILGTRYILDVLTDNGCGEIAFRMVDQKTYPGWGYMIENGATTLWERWEKITGGGMNSHNHIMFGSVDAWFYKTLAGLFPLAGGWKRFRVKPLVVSQMGFAMASLRTVAGPIRVSWERKDPGLVMLVSVPVNSRAEIHVPADPGENDVVENGRVVWKSGNPGKPGPGWKILKATDGHVVLETGSGDYIFTVRKRKRAKSR